MMFFMGYWKGALAKPVINIFDINCTRKNFTRTKCRTRGNFFLEKPVQIVRKCIFW